MRPPVGYPLRVIQRVRVKNLRGIRAGELDDLRGLTILLGPNGSGKSAILEALLIAASPNAGDAVGRAVRRRTAVSAGARWLVWRSGSAGPAEIEAHGPGLTTWAQIAISDATPRPEVRGDALLQVDWVVEPSRLSALVWFQYGDGATTPRVRYLVEQLDGRPHPTTFVRMIDPGPAGNDSDLAKVFSGVKEAGRRADAERLLREVVPELEQLELLVDDQGRPVVGVTYGGAEPRAVPVALAGDGVLVLTRIVLELAICPSGLALLEEPELHQHPRSLRRIAQAIVAAVARDVQIVLTTHSEELVRMLLEEASARAILERAAVVKVKLDGGDLRCAQLAGDAALRAIDEFGDDLR